jgi:hypothetical protein
MLQFLMGFPVIVMRLGGIVSDKGIAANVDTSRRGVGQHVC